MQKILCINEEIPVTCYHFESFPLAIISNYKEALPWIHSNYIQLAFHKDFINAPVPFKFYLLDYTMVPWLTVQKLDREIYPLVNEDIINFIKKALDLEYYIYLNVDEYYIPHRVAYKKIHKSHDILIFGYDDETSEFSVLGYNEKYLFAKTKVSFELFREGFLGLNTINNNCTQIYLYKFKKNSNYTFRLTTVIDSLKEYLLSIDSSEKFNSIAEPEDLVFGIKCYDYLDKYLEIVYIENKEIDIRYLQKLLEHKVCMFRRIKYLEQEKYLNESSNCYNMYNKVVKDAKHIKLLAMKFNKTYDTVTLLSIQEKIQLLKQIESDILFKVVKEISKF